MANAQRDAERAKRRPDGDLGQKRCRQQTTGRLLPRQCLAPQEIRRNVIADGEFWWRVSPEVLTNEGDSDLRRRVCEISVKVSLAVEFESATGAGWAVNSWPSAFERRSEERRVGKECRSRWSPYH